jgi:hypothetical protein
MNGSKYSASLYSNGIPVLGFQDDDLDNLIAYSVVAMEKYGSSANAMIFNTSTKRKVCEFRKDTCE